jgi:hypothetical protein
LTGDKLTFGYRRLRGRRRFPLARIQVSEERLIESGPYVTVRGVLVAPLGWVEFPDLYRKEDADEENLGR